VQLLEGKLEPDKIIATPEMLSVLQRHKTLPRFLGPKGLFPNVKRGTVVDDVAKAISEASSALDWKTTGGGVICTRKAAWVFYVSACIGIVLIACFFPSYWQSEFALVLT
jgi:hypothetical protein